jgi:hypothetical protein
MAEKLSDRVHHFFTLNEIRFIRASMSANDPKPT